MEAYDSCAVYDNDQQEAHEALLLPSPADADRQFGIIATAISLGVRVVIRNPCTVLPSNLINIVVSKETEGEWTR